MAGLHSRNKGKKGEREVVGILQPTVDDVYRSCGLLPPVLQRNQNQSHLGGCDIIGLDWLAVEVKLDKSLAVDTWWEQTLRQCGQQQSPVLFFRRDNVKWRVRSFVTMQSGGVWLTMPAVLSVEDWMRWFRARLLDEIAGKL